MKKNNVLNDIDKKILSVLQENADLPISELSKKVNLSPTPCRARLTNFINKDLRVLVTISRPAKVKLKCSRFCSDKN